MKPFLLGLLLWFLVAFPAMAERVALVIGNSAYVHAPTLKNPVNDAQDVAEALNRLGFVVHLGTDLGTDAMRGLLRDFSRDAEGAELALFFYAGHGLQVDGRNFLIPVDAVIERESDLDFAAIELQLVLKQLERSSAHSIILLDACRDNPFETALARTMGAARSIGALGRGLAPVDTTGGALIGFATDPGAVAFDGAGENSPFTAALLTHLETPGLEVNALMTRVRADVVAATGRLQRPWSTSSLLDEVYLMPAAPTAETADPLLTEVAVWKAADQAGTAEALQAYLNAYPDGLFADMARDRLEEVTRLAALGSTVEPVVPEPVVRADEGPKVGDPADTSCRDCPAFVALAGGTFTMGSSGPEGTAAEGPPTPVTLKPFRLSTTEVTIGQFRAFIQATGYSPGADCYVWTSAGKMRLDKSAGWQDPGVAVSDSHPVACVNWQDAQAYADWLAKTLGQPVRLPSEAELEYAIRAGAAPDAPITAESACAVINGADAGSRFGWRNTACTDGFPDLAPVAAMPADALGLHDTLGNLWEWTGDCWAASHSGASPEGTARTKGDCASRVLRGGSWDDPLQNLRAAYRVGIPAKRRQANVGFRVAVDG
jgi:formylglycine-generating enzyme required for sulfatase activity